MKRRFAALALGLALASGPALAQGFKEENVYIGGGIGFNSVSGLGSATGFQFFGGYRLDTVDIAPLNLAIELGYMRSGNFSRRDPFFGRRRGSADGLWTTAVVDYPLDPQWRLIGRLGLDFGDDDGLMIGFGAGYSLSREFDLRAEYVIRDNIDSAQFNLIYRF